MQDNMVAGVSVPTAKTAAATTEQQRASEEAMRTNDFFDALRGERAALNDAQEALESSLHSVRTRMHAMTAALDTIDQAQPVAPSGNRAGF